jgi:hypothetical protein
MRDDEEDVAHAEQPEASPTESEEPSGQDTGDGNEEGDLSAQRGDGEEDDGEPPSRSPGEPEAEPRGSARFQRLANDARTAREEAGRARQELEEFKRQQWQREQQIQEREDRDRVALMTPDERADYRITRFEQAQRQRDSQRDIHMQAQLDKSTYDNQAAINPVYKRMQAQVEQTFQEQMRQGKPTDRRTILAYLIGLQALDGAANSGPAKRGARKRVENQTVKPSRPAGDQAATSSRKLSTAEDRLKDVLI